MREEYAARTLRPKIRRELAHLLRGWHEAVPRRVSLGLDVAAEPFDVEALLAGLGVEPMAPAVWRGGTGQARAHLVRFLQRGLDRYAAERNDPLAEAVSNQSPYLHFGQISPLEVALQVQAHGGPGAEAYLEELIVRRELAANMVHYNPGYDCYEQAVPAWAQATLAHHAGDDREWHYSAGDLAAGRTHDAYWNAAQREMVLTGKMHGYMRMYWGKQLIAWAGSPRAAFELALALNDRYELDGRDPNGYAGVAWCFGKHDRPWPERSIYGHVRTMTAGGLRRKFDMAAYVARVAALDAAGNVQAPPS
jgi:deoxyribodipyrimidine photo-lyase